MRDELCKHPDCIRPLGHPASHRSEAGVAFEALAPRPLDQAPQAPSPAADPALDALNRLLHGALLDMWTTADSNRADASTIRDALADRITPAEARIVLEWAPGLQHPTWYPPAEVRDLIARLGKIAEAGR